MPRRSPKPARVARDYVFATLPLCPRCHARDLRTYGTVDAGENALTRYTLCKTCGHKFFVVVQFSFTASNPWNS